MLCTERATKNRDDPIRCRSAYARQHYLDTTTPVPVLVESDKATATLRDGILEVTVPKSTQGRGQPVKIEVT
jgi:HSP20 family molecular chaperone IbpA